MSFQWDTPPDKAWGDLADAYRAAIEAALYQVVLRRAPEIEAWMKTNARWTDRTGNARQTLRGEAAQVVGQAVSVILSHGMDYGWYLEGVNPKTQSPMQNAGQWDVIGPAIDTFAPIIWGDIVAILRP